MISVEIVADSISESGDRITTFSLEYPRFIHSEVMTHRLFGRNAASSRAIPINKMMDQVLMAPAMPVEWGLNQAGMQAKEVHALPSTCEMAWQDCAERAVKSARQLQELGLHKQLVNRVLEPFQMMKTIVTATEFDNFFWLRCHEDAQPEIRVLADKMYGLYEESNPRVLAPGEWHVPYVEYMQEEGWYIAQGQRVTLEEAKKVSSSCCAQVSYRKLDDSLDKALMIYGRLVNTTPVHASPFEHIATPMETPNLRNSSYGYDLDAHDAEVGVTHFDSNGSFWSGNLKGWVQYRQLIDNNACWEYNT
jgi:thymidylate synthase ThyX